ncbi:MAG: hypothetical protein KBA06_02845, partial [Saprospiraceae bacterium]|nr:hypothetical protein [Saprospiraceae bacterium]
MMIKSFKFMFIIANLCIYCGFSTCQSTDHKIWQSSNFSYDFQNPNKVLSLSDTLREISGIVNDGAYFWAINDEQGAIYK